MPLFEESYIILKKIYIAYNKAMGYGHVNCGICNEIFIEDDIDNDIVYNEESKLWTCYNCDGTYHDEYVEERIKEQKIKDIRIKFIVTFFDKSYNKNIIEKLPCKKYSMGSVVKMKNTEPWLDFNNVPLSILNETVEYIDSLKKNITIKIILSDN